MLYNGELATTPTTFYTAPLPTPGIPSSGSNVTVNLFRIVNESGADRTITIWVNTSGTARAITPIDLQLPIGAAWDDVPVFQIPSGGMLVGEADAAGVSWTINASI